MKLTAKLKLVLDDQQHDLLLLTLERANEACDHISAVAWQEETFRQYPLHHLTYYDVRDRFGLSAQATVRAIGKVADAYKVDSDCQRTFRRRGAFPFDRNMVSFKIEKQTVSIWTMGGRECIPYVCGERQRELLQGKRGQSDLCYIDGNFYLFVSCEVETPTPDDVDGFLGVDTGVTNIATDSDGNNYSSAHLNGLRRRYQRVRSSLQSIGTKSAKRLLRKRRRKESRFAKDVNHCISKELVARAKDTGRGIAVEDLTGIRERVTATKAHRRQLHCWAFHDLRKKIEYKAELAGIPVAAVDPRNTSRTCPSCGHVDKRNRRTQAEFHCVECGHSGHADVIAAGNIASRGATDRPNAGGKTTKVA